MLSRSARQLSRVVVSGRFGASMVKRDLPPNMREMSDSTELACLWACMHLKYQAQCRERERRMRAPCGLVSLAQFGLRLIVSFPPVPLHSGQKLDQYKSAAQPTLRRVRPGRGIKTLPHLRAFCPLHNRPTQISNRRRTSVIMTYQQTVE
jgi:hypothetical protein